MEETRRPGDSGQITRDYFDSLLVEFRHIDSALPSTAFTLFGETFSTPVMTAALSHLNKVHPGGLTEMARGAKAANAVMWVGMGEDGELESIVGTGARTIKIIKPHADNAEVFRKIEHAERTGAFAVGMDIDHAFNHRGEYDTVLGLPMRPKSLEELKSFVKATKLPFVIKGVLSVQDAEKCLEAGVSGIVLSHHHGIMDYAVPPLLLLPRVAEAAKGRIPIFLDCDVNRGLDVFKSIALGACAASVGRALMGPLGESGADGVEKAIGNMTAELAHAMALTCSPDLNSIDPKVIWRV